MSAALTTIVVKPCRIQRNPTVKAVRQPPWVMVVSSTSVSSRGKKMRKRSNLNLNVNHLFDIRIKLRETHIMAKQDHWTPTCAIPRSPAKHSNELTVLQQATSALEAGRTSIFANAQVPDVVPRRMKYGDMPSDVPRDMIRKCCGR
jgi:hypothetical protein